MLLVMEQCAISLDRVICINRDQEQTGPSGASNFTGEKQWVLSQDSRVALLTQVAFAMRFLHKNGIVHRDIKPGNILLDKSATVKIADFGCSKDGLLSKQRAVGVEMTANIGTPVYMAPELHTAGRIAHYSNKCDVYAFALVAWSRAAIRQGAGRDATRERRNSQHEQLCADAARVQRHAPPDPVASGTDVVPGTAAGLLAPGPGTPAIL